MVDFNSVLYAAILISGFTKKDNVDQLVYFEGFDSNDLALLREKQIKKWRREKKDVLVKEINPTWNDLYDKIPR